MRKTHALVQVAMVIMDDPRAKLWGYDLSKKSGVRSGVLYPILGRMLEDGWLADGWEDPAQITGKRPPRRYYTLTDDGARELGAVLASAANEPRFASLLNWGMAQ